MCVRCALILVQFLHAVLLNICALLTTHSRISAFYLCSYSLRLLVETVFSKLNAKCWPNIDRVVDKVSSTLYYFPE